MSLPKTGFMKFQGKLQLLGTLVEKAEGFVLAVYFFLFFLRILLLPLVVMPL